jgi:hypothetical protein
MACYVRCVGMVGFVLSSSIELKWANGGTDHFIVAVDGRVRRCESNLEWVPDMICDVALAEVGEVVVACI